MKKSSYIEIISLIFLSAAAIYMQILQDRIQGYNDLKQNLSMRLIDDEGLLNKWQSDLIDQKLTDLSVHSGLAILKRDCNKPFLDNSDYYPEITKAGNDYGCGLISYKNYSFIMDAFYREKINKLTLIYNQDLDYLSELERKKPTIFGISCETQKTLTYYVQFIAIIVLIYLHSTHKKDNQNPVLKNRIILSK